MKIRCFITGTDTDVGKTLIAQALLYKAAEQGLQTAGFKPIAAGVDAHGKNVDALLLQQASTVPLSYAQVNPLCFTKPMAPHIAAAQEKRRLRGSQISGFIRGMLSHTADFIVIEGAGGWALPLNHSERFDHVVAQLKLPVVIVVGMRLGCLNHALLTAQAVQAKGLPMAWVATQIDPHMKAVQANLDTLSTMMPGQYLGFIPHDNNINPQTAANHLHGLPQSESVP